MLSRRKFIDILKALYYLLAAVNNGKSHKVRNVECLSLTKLYYTCLKHFSTNDDVSDDQKRFF